MLTRGSVLLSRRCVALVLSGACPTDGRLVFADFLQQNSACFWNACLIRSVASLEYRGCLVPSTLLVSGSDFALEVLRSAWARRVLRPPKGYTITKLGDLCDVEMVEVGQTQFAPLSEALCKVVTDLRDEGQLATSYSIRARMRVSFPDMQSPSEDILHKALGGLIRERKIYHTGNGYSVVTPDTYRERGPSLCERQMLLTNEEAIVRLHARNDEMNVAWSQSTQVPSSPDLDRSSSLRRRRGVASTPGDASKNRSLKETRKIGFEIENDLNDLPKSEKQSMLAKLLKRMQFLSDRGAKHLVFSAQFPPLEWLDTSILRLHTVATQTKPYFPAKVPEQTLEVPWQEKIDNKTLSNPLSPDAAHRRLYQGKGGRSPLIPIPNRASGVRYSPPHRTFPNYSKKRRKHRATSNELPQNIANQSRSTSSKSNADNSDDKTPVEENIPKPFEHLEQKHALNCCSENETPASSSSVGEHKELKNIPLNQLCKSSTAKKSSKDAKLGKDLLPDQKYKPAHSSLNNHRQKKIDPKEEHSSNHEDSTNHSLSKEDNPNPVDYSNTGHTDIVVDNTVSVEVSLEKSLSPKPNISTTIVTEETTVTKGSGNSKIVTVTNVTTSLSKGEAKKFADFDTEDVKSIDLESEKSSENEKLSVNDLNLGSHRNAKIIDCSSTCNIVTEAVK